MDEPKFLYDVTVICERCGKEETKGFRIANKSQIKFGCSNCKKETIDFRVVDVAIISREFQHGPLMVVVHRRDIEDVEAEPSKLAKKAFEGRIWSDITVRDQPSTEEDPTVFGKDLMNFFNDIPDYVKQREQSEQERKQEEQKKTLTYGEIIEKLESAGKTVTVEA